MRFRRLQIHKNYVKKMSILSITFHAIPAVLQAWEQYTEDTLALMAENLMDAEKYILSEVESEMISEGKNTNLLLIFDNNEKRREFLDSEFKNIEERIQSTFGDAVMIFVTSLDVKKARL